MQNSFSVFINPKLDDINSLSEDYLAHDCEILLVSHDEAVFELQRELEKSGRDVEAMQVNLGTFAGTQHLVHHLQNYGKILDSLFYNVPESFHGEFNETSLKEEILFLNEFVLGSTHLLKKILPEMAMRKKGTLFLYKAALSDSPVLSSAEFYLSHLFDQLEKEYRSSEIRFIKIDSGIKKLGNSFITKIQNYASKILPEKSRSQLQ